MVKKTSLVMLKNRKTIKLKKKLKLQKFWNICSKIIVNNKDNVSDRAVLKLHYTKNLTHQKKILKKLFQLFL